MDDPEGWAQQMEEGTRSALGTVLPFTDAERGFLDRVLDNGEIEPSIIATDVELAHRILHHPGLAWKARNVREFKGI